VETSLEHADERDLIETFVERSRWHCRAARESFSTDEFRPVTTVLRVVAQSRNAAQHCEAQAAKSNRDKIGLVECIDHRYYMTAKANAPLQREVVLAHLRNMEAAIKDCSPASSVASLKPLASAR